MEPADPYIVFSYHFDTDYSFVVALSNAYLQLLGGTTTVSSSDAGFNTSTGQTGALQLPERKTDSRDWYELVRLDLYDVQ